MIPVKLLSTIAISALLLVPATASAQDTTKARGERSEEVGDGNRMICRTSGVTGSRVKSGRICMTADEWAANKRETRNRVEQEQTRRSTQDM
jgi:hypothetical protein